MKFISARGLILGSCLTFLGFSHKVRNPHIGNKIAEENDI